MLILLNGWTTVKIFISYDHLVRTNQTLRKLGISIFIFPIIEPGDYSWPLISTYFLHTIYLFQLVQVFLNQVISGNYYQTSCRKNAPHDFLLTIFIITKSTMWHFLAYQDW